MIVGLFDGTGQGLQDGRRVVVRYGHPTGCSNLARFGLQRQPPADPDIPGQPAVGVRAANASLEGSFLSADSGSSTKEADLAFNFDSPSWGFRIEFASFCKPFRSSVVIWLSWLIVVRGHETAPRIRTTASARRLTSSRTDGDMPGALAAARSESTADSSCRFTFSRAVRDRERADDRAGPAAGFELGRGFGRGPVRTLPSKGLRPPLLTLTVGLSACCPQR